MDPQQKLILDCVYMAMEDGGIVSKDLEKTLTGVYIGRLQVSRPELIKLFSCSTQLSLKFSLLINFKIT